MKHTNYLVEYANGDTEHIKAMGVLACIIKASKDRLHLESCIPSKITDTDNDITYTDISILWNRNYN